MTKYFSAALCAALLTLAPHASAAAGKLAGSARVDGSYKTWEYRWRGENAGTYQARYKLFERNGSLVLCGAGHISGTVSRSENKSALRAAKVLLDGKEIMKDLSFFENTRRLRDLDIGSATCFFTGAKGKLVPDAKIELVIPSRALR